MSKDFRHNECPPSSYFLGWYSLVSNLKVFLLERTLWRQERMRKRCGCFGGTAPKRFAVRVWGNWRRTLRRGRKKTETSSATTGARAAWVSSDEIVRQKDGCVLQEFVECKVSLVLRYDVATWVWLRRKKAECLHQPSVTVDPYVAWHMTWIYLVVVKSQAAGSPLYIVAFRLWSSFSPLYVPVSLSVK